jgi:hypothetical protein
MRCIPPRSSVTSDYGAVWVVVAERSLRHALLGQALLPWQGERERTLIALLLLLLLLLLLQLNLLLLQFQLG